MALRTKRADGIDLTDPQEQVSLAHWFALSIALLLFSTVWAVYREISGLRPWKGYQAQFQRAASAHYTNQLRAAQEELARARKTAAYREAADELEEAGEEFDSRQGEIDALSAERSEKQALLEAKREELKPIRLEYQYSVYNWEQAAAQAKPGWKSRILAVQTTVNELLAETLRLDEEINALSAKIFAVGQGKLDAQAKVSEFEAEVARLSGLIQDVEGRQEQVVQFYVPALDHATDRCASCHVGALYSGLGDIEKTLGSMSEFKYETEKYASLFKSHPGDYLQRHPPEKFGCTSCHAGDGLMLSSEWEAHGTHHHHEEPLLTSPTHAPKAFGSVAEAGCNKCHMQEMELPGAPLLSFGKQLFAETCAGCHKAKGIWPDEDALDAAGKHLESVRDSLMKTKAVTDVLTAAQLALDEKLTSGEVDDDQYDAQDRRLAARKEANRLERLRIEEAERMATRDVEDRKLDRRSIGPDLRNLREKVRPDWIKQWLQDPHAFYEKTKMPNFLLPEEHVEAIAAFLWQAARAPRPGYDRGPPRDEETIERGAKLFSESGCLACHVGKDASGELVDVRPQYGTGEDGKPIVMRGFGPELTRTGEKARFEWMWRWIYDPHELSPTTRMPNLRLQEDQARAIAAYLATQTKDEVPGKSWREVPEYLDDEERGAKGYQLVQRYGCYSCHAIQDKDQPDKLMGDRFGRIGVELSAHGSKTLHLFDFGLIEHQVQENMWGEAHHPNVTRFDYIAYKVRRPRDFEEGRYYQGPEDESHLRMPFLNLSREEAHAVATFVTSLVEKGVPEEYRYEPGYPAGAVAAGRTVTQKHNCIACHKMEKDRGGFLTARWEDKNFAPPTLQGEGRRVQPDWMFEFLKQPEHIRPWLSVRMPDFHLSDHEAQQISEYFQAVDDQAYPFVHRPQVHLDPEEYRDAKELVDGQCKRCHSLGESYDPKGQAPLLDAVKQRIKPEWITPWVLNPPRVIPYTRMPNLKLTDRQARIVADYLQVLNTDFKPGRGPWKPDVHRAHPPAVITEN